MKPDFEKMVYDRLAGKQVVYGGLPYTRQFGEMFVAALEETYAAGLERAAEIADAYEGSGSAERADDPCSAVACDIADSIRAEKENDNG